MTTNEMYQQLGISPEVLDFGQRVLDGLDEEMSRVDDIAEYNQAKVLSAMHKNRLNATHFNLSSGYGYDDEGRDNLERVYADVFHTEAALVRPQITCGTHALALALGANLLPGDELLSPSGRPMTPWRRSSAFAPPPVPCGNMASATVRWSFFRTEALTTTASGPPSTKKPSW